jgi:hypothetical protein
MSDKKTFNPPPTTPGSTFCTEKGNAVSTHTHARSTVQGTSQTKRKKEREREGEREREREGGRGSKGAESWEFLCSEIRCLAGHWLFTDTWRMDFWLCYMHARTHTRVCAMKTYDEVLPSTDQLHQLRFMLMFRPYASDAPSCSNKNQNLNLVAETAEHKS